MLKKWAIPLLFTVAAVAMSLFVYADLPEQIAIHFGPSGEPDNWMARPYGAFLAPALIIVLTAILLASVKLDRDDSRRMRAEASIGFVAAIAAALLFAVHVFMLRHSLGYPMNPNLFATVAVGVVFVLLGNQVPRLGMRDRQWPRIPEAARGRFSRLQGRLMVAFGFAFLLLALLPSAYMMPGFFLCLGLYVCVLFGCVFYYSRKAG